MAIKTYLPSKDYLFKNAILLILFSFILSASAQPEPNEFYELGVGAQIHLNKVIHFRPGVDSTRRTITEDEFKEIGLDICDFPDGTNPDISCKIQIRLKAFDTNLEAWRSLSGSLSVLGYVKNANLAGDTALNLTNSKGTSFYMSCVVKIWSKVIPLGDFGYDCNYKQFSEALKTLNWGITLAKPKKI